MSRAKQTCLSESAGSPTARVFPLCRQRNKVLPCRPLNLSIRCYTHLSGPLAESPLALNRGEEHEGRDEVVLEDHPPAPQAWAHVLLRHL